MRRNLDGRWIIANSVGQYKTAVLIVQISVLIVKDPTPPPPPPKKIKSPNRNVHRPPSTGQGFISYMSIHHPINFPWGPGTRFCVERGEYKIFV